MREAKNGDSEVAAENASTSERPQEPDYQTRIIPGDEHRPIVQPGPLSEPLLVLPLPSFPEGKGRELFPNHTGGGQVPQREQGDLTTEFPIHGHGPLIHTTPDQSEELSQPLYALNKEGTPIYDEIPISPRFIGKANKKHHPEDVWFDEKGYPIFDKYTIATVKIELSGSRDRDKRLASRKALDLKLLTEIPDDYVWHHHQDMTTMQLVLKSIHDAVDTLVDFQTMQKRKGAW